MMYVWPNYNWKSLFLSIVKLGRKTCHSAIACERIYRTGGELVPADNGAAVEEVVAAHPPPESSPLSPHQCYLVSVET